MIVFLKCCGVCHPRNPREFGLEEFCYLPRIEAVLRESPHARIVLCSGWGRDTAWEDLIAVFAEDMRPRVIGVTPNLEIPDDWVEHLHYEAMRYLEDNGLSATQWVALDNVAENWPENDSRLVLCRDGFFGFEAMQLREALSEDTGWPLDASELP